jgi:hypothetical protein
MHTLILETLAAHPGVENTLTYRSMPAVNHEWREPGFLSRLGMRSHRRVLCCSSNGPVINCGRHGRIAPDPGDALHELLAAARRDTHHK